jgi:hemolysin activation/secretion protein
MNPGPSTIAQSFQLPEQALIASQSSGNTINSTKGYSCSEADSLLKAAVLPPSSPANKALKFKSPSGVPKVVERVNQYLARIDDKFAASNAADVADCITKIYLNSGYVLSGVSSDVVSEAASKETPIKAIESQLSKITYRSEKKAPSDTSESSFEKYLSERIRSNLSTPINWNTLEDNLMLLKNDPLLKTEAFRAELFKVVDPAKPDNSYPDLISETADLKIFYNPASRFYTGFSSDNYLSSSVGSTRGTSTIGFRNLVGIGDNLALSYSRSSTGGAQSYDISYQRILNPLNGVIQFRVAPNSYRITEDPYKSLGIRGTSTLYEFNLRQPLIRTLRKELALSLGFSAQTGQSFYSNTIPLSNTDTKLLKFGQDYRTQNSTGGWQLGSQFNLGFQTNQSKSFFSWQGQIDRFQKVNDHYFISAQLSLQLTPQNLATSQEFFLGGAQSLRGYRTNALSSDNGLRLALENRISLAKSREQDTFLAVPFLDLGYAWNNANSPKDTPLPNLLVSAGLGLIWQPSRNMGVRLDYGIPLSQASINGINLRNPSLYFSVNYRP